MWGSDPALVQIASRPSLVLVVRGRKLLFHPLVKRSLVGIRKVSFLTRDIFVQEPIIFQTRCGCGDRKMEYIGRYYYMGGIALVRYRIDTKQTRHLRGYAGGRAGGQRRRCGGRFDHRADARLVTGRGEPDCPAAGIVQFVERLERVIR